LLRYINIHILTNVCLSVSYCDALLGIGYVDLLSLTFDLQLYKFWYFVETHYYQDCRWYYHQFSSCGLWYILCLGFM